MRRYEERYEEWTPCMVCDERVEACESNVDGLCAECAHKLRNMIEDWADQQADEGKLTTSETRAITLMMDLCIAINPYRRAG